MSGYYTKEVIGQEGTLIRQVYFVLSCNRCFFTVSSQDWPVDVSDGQQAARKEQIMQNIANGHNRFAHNGLAVIFITPYYIWIKR